MKKTHYDSNKTSSERKSHQKKWNATKQSTNKSFDHCDIKFQCQSCHYVNKSYQECLKDKHSNGLKILEAGEFLPKNVKIFPPHSAPKALAYRTVAKLAIRRNRKSKNSADRFLIGLFKPGSHEVVDVSFCPVQMITINKCVRYIKKILRDSDLSPWDEESEDGDLKYLVLRASHITQDLLITFVGVSKDVLPKMREIAKKIKQEQAVQGIHFNVNAEPGNQIFGDKTYKLVGREKLRENLCDFAFEISPRSFFQVNPWQANHLYRRLEQLIGFSEQNAIAWDLYSGVAPISMILARAGYKVLAVEENPDAVADGVVHSQLNKLEGKISFVTGRIEECHEELPTWAKRPEIIVVNPSRAGIALQTRIELQNILRENPNLQFFYVSCDVSTLARDLKELSLSGHKVRQIEAFDMFAQTDKLEWLAVMTN